jgi:Flp pilus assembly protein TadG
MRRHIARAARDSEATATLEFALVVPVLLTLLLVGLDFSRTLLAYSTIANASREAARYATLHFDAGVDDIKKNAIDRYAGPLDPNALSVSVEYSDNGGGTFKSDWPAVASRPPRTVTVRVTVRYPWQSTSAIAAGFLTATSGSAVLASAALMDGRR